MAGVDRTGVDEFFHLLDNVYLTSVGIDIGSSTSQLMFSEIHMRREATDLSTRYVVASRNVLWRSRIRLTPYLDEGLIDAEAVGQFVRENYISAGLDRADVDSGAIILTGEALKRDNARALADAVAESAGDFVCVTAGHRLEAMLAAFGSGSVHLSECNGWSVLCVDVGGGTTKLSRIEHGRVAACAAIEVGGRILAWNENRRLVHVTPMAGMMLPDHGDLQLGDYFSPAAEHSLAAAIAKQILAVPAQRLADLDERLVLTEGPNDVAGNFDAVTFSGGVAEYVFGRERNTFGDLGHSVGAALRAAIDAGAVSAPVVDPGQGIRATVIGTSQCSVQVSGSTVTSSDTTLPLRNVPVVDAGIDLSGDISTGAVAAAIDLALRTQGIGDGPFALSVRWAGAPSYRRLAAFAAGVHEALGHRIDAPLIVMLDKDLGASVGAILTEDFGYTGGLICLDNLELKPLDYVDIGSRIPPAGVFPVVIKSLLFGTTPPPDELPEPRTPTVGRAREGLE